VDGEEVSGFADGAGVPYVLDECRENNVNGDCSVYPGLEEDFEDAGVWAAPGGPWLRNDVDVDGLFGGVQVGYMAQFDGFVLGARADASLSTINGENPFFAGECDSSDDNEPCDGDDDFNVPDQGGDVTLNYVVATPSNFKVDYGWMASARLVAGFLASPDLLLYVNGGAAVADVEIQSVGTQGPWTDINDSSTELGWIGGVGGELRLNEEISVFLEGAYADFGSYSVFHKEAPNADVTIDSDLYMVNFGINWRPQ
jgi:opacity protein-like surface antigen